MGTLVEHDRDANCLHIQFTRDRLIARTAWIANNATIAMAADDEPISITIYDYYTNPQWPLNEPMVHQYALGPYVDDLRLVYQTFFAPPSLAVKTIHYEGPDGNEIVIPAD